MSCQSLIKPVKLLSFRNFQYRYIHSNVSYASFSYLYSFRRQNLKCISRINKFRHIPSVNFQTSNKYFDSSEEEDLSQPLVKLTFITPEGEEVQIEGRVGLTVMQAAVKNNIPMEAACDGQLACTTCHVYLEEDTKKFFEDATTEEEDLLDAAPFVRPNSRLSCQLKISENFENARFHLPSATSNFSVDGKISKHS